MRSQPVTKGIGVGITIAAAALLPTVSAGAAEQPKEPISPPPDGGSTVEGRHCTTRLLTAEEMAAGALSTVDCFDTFADAMDSVGVDVPPDAPLEEQRSAARASGLVLAFHYDYTNGMGDEMAVTGSSCQGGGISLTPGSFWDNRISSTRHSLCTQVKHWAGNGYSGSTKITDGGFGVLRNLTGLDNATSSIRYY